MNKDIKLGLIFSSLVSSFLMTLIFSYIIIKSLFNPDKSITFDIDYFHPILEPLVDIIGISIMLIISCSALIIFYLDNRRK